MGSDRTIWLVRGTDRTIRVYAKDDSGAPFDLTGCVGTLTVKLRKEDASATFSKVTSTGSQGRVISAASGGMEFYIGASDTASLAPDSYVYDVQIVQTLGSPPVVKRYVVIPMSRLELQYDIG